MSDAWYSHGLLATRWESSRVHLLPNLESRPMKRILGTAILMLILAGAGATTPAFAQTRSHETGCQTVIANLSVTGSGTSRKMGWSGVATGCFTSVSKRVCVKLVEYFPSTGNFGNTLYGPDCSSYSTSSSRTTPSVSVVCSALTDTQYYRSVAYSQKLNGASSDVTDFSDVWLRC